MDRIEDEAALQSLRQFSEMLDESQWWPADQLRSWQRRHLQLLLMHARATSPFYKFRLNKAFLPSGGVDWDRWHEIPILTRHDVLEHFTQLLSTRPIADHGPYQDVQSSGSTGHPVTTRVTGWLMMMTAACNWRTQKWAGLDWSKTAIVTGEEDRTRKLGDDLGPWGPPWLESSMRGRMLYTHYRTPFDDRLRLFAESGAAYSMTTSFAAELMGQRARETGADVHFEAILARGGAVSDQLRQEMRSTFGAEIIEFYSSKEAGAIGQRCPSGSGYHVNAEAILVEIVDQNGMPVAPGEQGRMVVTPFASTALPLIRYDQGDIVVAGSVCSCGRALPHFVEISGRERAVFHHPDGRQRDRGLTQESREMIGAGQTQIAQVGPHQFEVRYVPHDWGTARDEAKFIAWFRSYFFEDAEVKLVALSEIPLSKSGKFLASVVEWDRNADPPDG